MIVVAGFPGGSSDIPQSLELREKSVGPIADLGVEIVDSIDDLLAKVDVVHDSEHRRSERTWSKPSPFSRPVSRCSLTNRSPPRLPRRSRYFNWRRNHNVPCFTSSSLRYAERTLNIRRDPLLGKLAGCDQYAPCALEPHHPDFLLVWHPWRRTTVYHNGLRLCVGHSSPHCGN